MPIGDADDDAVAAIEPAIALVERWLDDATTRDTRRSRATMSRLEGVVTDPIGLGFVMDFIDRVARPDDSRVAARQLRAVVDDGPLPRFLSSFDRLLLRAGSRLGIVVPWLVIPLARRRMRSLVGHLIAPADADELGNHLNEQRTEGWASNVNLLGEAVLGDDEASRRHAALIDLLALPDVDYVSVKLSSVVAQLNPWAWEESLDRVCERLADLVDHARMADPPTFVNVDMEEYHDLELTLEAFERVLGHPARRNVEAGIVLQAYLPDALGALQRLSSWAANRVDAGGAPIKVRLVKGANLAMEQVDAAIHGWEQAPYSTKADTDANYVRCLDWVLDPARLRGLRIGLASHNLFHVAWTLLLARDRGVGDRVQVEMLQGMAEGHAAAVKATLPQRPSAAPLHAGGRPGRLRRRSRVPLPTPRRECGTGQLSSGALRSAARVRRLRERSGAIPGIGHTSDGTLGGPTTRADSSPRLDQGLRARPAVPKRCRNRSESAVEPGVVANRPRPRACPDQQPLDHRPERNRRSGEVRAAGPAAVA